MTQVSVLLVGAIVLGPVVGDATWPVWVMASLALVVVRPGPVAIALLSTHSRSPTVAYLGWFGRAPFVASRPPSPVPPQASTL